MDVHTESLGDIKKEREREREGDSERGYGK